jgi:hypothetical protein
LHFLAVCSDLSENYDAIERLLKRYPSGPIFKSLDVLQERGEKEGFDPIFQKNLPSHLYTFASQSFYSKCLYLPCPTFNESITKAEVIDEFKGYLRYLKSQKEPKKHLLINLQDRTSWKEHARCVSLEELAKDPELSHSFILVTLPKKTDFYEQTDLYKEIDRAEEFLLLIDKQIESGEECGFVFPSFVQKEGLKVFLKGILPCIHRYFFGGKETLSRKERLDFIEIFYLFLSVKIFDLVRPDYFSFTCKDGVDIGAAMNGAFASLMKIIGNEGTWSIEEQGFLFWMLFAPSLLVRERLIDFTAFHRMISSLAVLSEHFEKEWEEIMRTLEPLYNFPFFKNITIERAA